MIAVQIYPLRAWSGLPDKLDLTGTKSSTLDPFVPRRPADFLHRGLEMSLNQHCMTGRQWYQDSNPRLHKASTVHYHDSTASAFT
ncbi:hypothetical protein TNCV_1849861 [Trichonephila clavipes]|nr:hypothetical protein TNCV_1849861 [Trichonephila clavipes]